MIVRPADGSLYLITQPDHAVLSRRVMERWVPLHNSDRRASILHAVEAHDNGWREPDDAPSVDPSTGRVLDFITIPVEVRQGVWPRAVSRLADDPWAAALVAQHAITVYDRFRTDAAWGHFFPQLEALRDLHVQASRRTLAQLTSDYVHVRLGDLISLTFCNRWSEEQQYGGWVIRLDADRVRVRVTPDAFDGREVPFAVRARTVPDVSFGSDEALREALRSAPPTLLHGSVSGAP